MTGVRAGFECPEGTRLVIQMPASNGLEPRYFTAPVTGWLNIVNHIQIGAPGKPDEMTGADFNLSSLSADPTQDGSLYRLAVGFYGDGGEAALDAEV